MKTQAQLNAIAAKVVNTYKSKSQIKRMELTIKDVFGIDTVEFKAVKKTAFDKINGCISENYDSAVMYAKDGRLSLLDAFKRACKSGKFVRELKNYDIEKDVDFIVKRFYCAVSVDGLPACKKYEYAVNKDGTYKKDENGNRIVIACWYEYKTITATNATAIVVNCVNRMKAQAKSEKTLADGWNVVKIGR